MTLDIGQDYMVVDDTATVLYQVKLGEPSTGTGSATYAEPVEVDYVYQESINKDDVVKHAYLLQGSKGAFHLWKAQLAGIVPKIADLITDAAGITWVVKVVLELDRDENGIQRYRCLCMKAH